MIAVYIIAGILVLFVIPHFLVTYIIFHEFFGRMSQEKIDKRVRGNPNYEKCVNEMFLEADRLKQDCQELDITSFDGLKLHGYYFDKGNDKIVMMFHGVHANSLFHFSIQARECLKRGYNVLIVDERAHSKSDGKYITYGVKEHKDVLSWIDHVSSNFKEKEIYLYGLSMGATSICLASQNLDNLKIKAMVIDSAFINISELVNNIVARGNIPKPLFIGGVKFLAKHLAGIDFNSFDTREALKNTKIPALFVQGTNDIVVSKQFLIDNYNNCASSKEILEVEGVGHTLAIPLGGEEAVDKLFNFLRSQSKDE